MILFSLASILLLALIGSSLVGRLVANLGIIQLQRDLAALSQTFTMRSQLDNYPQYGVLEKNEADHAIALLQYAVALDNDSYAARWGLGRIALASGKAEIAAAALAPLAKQARTNAFLYLDTLVAASRSNQDKNVVALFESSDWKMPKTNVVSDTLALAFMRQGNLEKAKSFRPDDLYLNYILLSQVSRESNEGRQYIDALTHFSINALNPRDEHLVDYAVQIIPNLLTEKIWDRTMTDNVLAFLVWRYPSSSSVEKTLQNLTSQYPNESEWHYYLAELYQRRGDWKQAGIVYQTIFSGNPKDMIAALRLGQIAEAQGDFEQASFWYKKYHNSIPEDVLGTKKSTQTPDELQSSNRENEFEADPSYTNDVVADALKIPSNQVTFGPNLLSNGEFEFLDWNQHWRVSDYATYSEITNSRGAFVMGLDSFNAIDNISALRFDGFWMSEGSRGFFGVVTQHPKHGSYALETQPNRIYMVSGTYRTGSEVERASVYLGNPEVSLIERWLPATNKVWHRFILIGCHKGLHAEFMQLILRTWSPGQVWFDDVSVREIGLPSGGSACAQSVIIQ